MTPELQRYYEDRIAMMNTPAWKELMEDVQSMVNATNKLNGVTVNNLQFKQGELSMMNWILNIKDISEETYEGLVNENDA